MQRTTIALDERIYARIKQMAEREGRYFQECANELLRLGLEAADRGTVPPLPLPVHSLGVPLVDIGDRDALLDVLDDEDP